MYRNELELADWTKYVHGDPPPEQDPYGRLFLAVQHNDDVRFKAALAEPDIDIYQLFGTAIIYGHLPVVIKLVGTGLDVNRRIETWIPVVLAMRHGNIRTALYLAAISDLADDEILLQALRNGHDLIAMLAAEAGANPNAFDENNNRSALEYAGARGYGNTTGRLLEKGADIAKYGEAALEAAKGHGNRRLIAQLKQAIEKTPATA